MMSESLIVFVHILKDMCRNSAVLMVCMYFYPDTQLDPSVTQKLQDSSYDG